MRYLKFITAALVLALGLSGSLQAQTREVSGRVLDTGGEPLIGAAVLLSGTTSGDVTDMEGAFRLRVPDGPVTLEISCLGYVGKTVPVPASQAQVTIRLEEDKMVLDETVVIGYGTQKKVNLTGAITVVESKELEDRTAHNLNNMLQGSVPGLNITTSAGNPGAAGSLNIRGITSINSADPLVLIDGVEEDISRVNPNDVANISVIKDASAAAIYGARAAYGVILITTKSGTEQGGKATVRYSGRMGWEEPTVSTDFETRGYWSVYTVDKFWMSDAGQKYTTYNDHDMAQLLARVNDKVEDPSRPWVVEEVRNGRRQWIYYANTDWYHELYRDRHPSQQHNLSVTGGNKEVKYYLSAGYDQQVGLIKLNPDVYQKYNLRAKIDASLNKYMRLSNNTAFFNSTYDYPGGSNIQDSFAYAARHALASFPLKNPDGSWLYATPMISGNYNVANGRHIVFGNGKHVNKQVRSDFSNTTELKITPFPDLVLTANYTYRLYQNRNTYRVVHIDYRQRPDGPIEEYTTGAGLDHLDEGITTSQRHSANFFGNYEHTWADAHHLTATAGMNMEHWHSKAVTASGQNLMSDTLIDLDLVGPDATGNTVMEVSGGQNQFAIMGFFGRLNYDYKGRYLLEVSGRYDGTSRFQRGHRWGFFPSASVGWRISEEPFFQPLRGTVDNLKIRASYGNLGNQVVRKTTGGQDYFAYMREITIHDFAGYTFGEGATMSKYSSLDNPVDASLTWETAEQYNVGLDLGMFNNRLTFTGEVYRRNTLNMLTAGPDLPAIYGADSPKTNAADLRTEGYELSLGWRDQFTLAGHPFGYHLRANLSDFRTIITRYNNPTKSLAMAYYEGMRVGEIWGYVVDGLFKTDEEAKDYTTNVLDCSMINGRMTGGFRAGDLRFVDLDNDGGGVEVNTLGTGANTVDKPGDRKILGNSLPSLQYGFTFGFDWLGFDVSAFFQGTGNHYWYPAGMNYMFWGPYSWSYVSFLQRDFIQRCWSEENPDTYFPRPRAYSATGGELARVNSRYLQNIRYLRFKNLTAGYTLPSVATRKVGIEKVRFYFSGENLFYWSPLKANTRYLDPESAYTRNGDSADAHDHISYPWQKTIMFGLDITF
jgi:TonB-linked SusC/RagA family outer membrane protein